MKDKPLDLSKKVEAFVPPSDTKWKPTPEGQTTTMTMPFGGQIPKMVDCNPPKEA